MICTSNHHSISYYLACTDRPDGRRATRHLENRKPAATAATEETPERLKQMDLEVEEAHYLKEKQAGYRLLEF